MSRRQRAERSPPLDLNDFIVLLLERAWPLGLARNQLNRQSAELVRDSDVAGGRPRGRSRRDLRRSPSASRPDVAGTLHAHRHARRTRRHAAMRAEDRTRRGIRKLATGGWGSSAESRGFAAPLSRQPFVDVGQRRVIEDLAPSRRALPSSRAARRRSLHRRTRCTSYTPSG